MKRGKRRQEQDRRTRLCEGKECTLNIAHVCTYDVTTSVPCHIKFRSGDAGIGFIPNHFVIGCSACHDYLDSNKLEPDEKWFYLCRALTRTIERLGPRYWPDDYEEQWGVR